MDLEQILQLEQATKDARLQGQSEVLQALDKVIGEMQDRSGTPTGTLFNAILMELRERVIRQLL